MAAAWLLTCDWRSGSPRHRVSLVALNGALDINVWV